MAAESWTIAEAKARFGELIDRANRNGPQTITRHGRTAAVVVSAEQWNNKIERRGNLADFFAASPLRDSRIVDQRVKESD